MNPILTKAKLLVLPLLLLAFCFTTVYLFLFWLCCMLLQFEGLSEDITHIWTPVALASLLVLLIIRPRVHLLKLDRNDGRIRSLYYMVAAAVLCVPTIIGVHYVEAAAGKLTQLSYISEIKTKPLTRYYKPDAFVLNKSAVGIHSRWSYSGKHNRDLNFDIYLAMPFGDHLYDTLGTAPAFLLYTYHRQVSSSLSEAERKSEWQVFWDKSMDDFFIKDQPRFVYLERIGNTDERKYGTLAAKKTDRYRGGEPVLILEPRYEPFSDRTGNKLRSLIASLGIGMVLWLIMILIPGLHINKVRQFATRKQKAGIINWAERLDFIRPREGFLVTPVLMGLNLLAFIVLVLNGSNLTNIDASELLAAGGLYEPLVQQGQWWRLLTSMFLHGGLMHIVMNLFSLYLCGILLEGFAGSKRFAALYLISGFAGALASMWWHQQPVVAVGASGAIFGLYGMMLAFIITRRLGPDLNRFMLILLGSTAGFSLLMGLLTAGVDNSAHIGGLIAGFVLGLLLYFYQRQAGSKEPVAESREAQLRMPKKNRYKADQPSRPA